MLSLQTITKPHFYPQFCQFSKKIIPVLNSVCACIRTSAEDDNFSREDGGCVYIMIIWEFLRFDLLEKALFQVILGLLGISIRSFL